MTGLLIGNRRDWVVDFVGKGEESDTPPKVLWFGRFLCVFLDETTKASTSFWLKKHTSTFSATRRVVLLIIDILMGVPILP